MRKILFTKIHKNKKALLPKYLCENIFGSKAVFFRRGVF